MRRGVLFSPKTRHQPKVFGAHNANAYNNAGNDLLAQGTFDEANVLKNLSIIGYFGMIAGLLGLLAMQSLFSSSPLVISVQVAAFLLFLWARITFGRRSYHVAADPTDGGLVIGGPYRYIRHPIYAAMCLFTLAGVVGHWSWSSGLIGGLVLTSAVTRILCEETLVVACYPEYAQYSATTWRMIPYIY